MLRRSGRAGAGRAESWARTVRGLAPSMDTSGVQLERLRRSAAGPNTLNSALRATPPERVGQVLSILTASGPEPTYFDHRGTSTHSNFYTGKTQLTPRKSPLRKTR